MDVEISSDKHVDFEPSHLASAERRRDAMNRFQVRIERGFDHLHYEIRRVRLRLTDINGPRGGVDKRAMLKVELWTGETVCAEQLSEAVEPAVDGAIARARRAVARKIRRRRTLARRGRRARAEAAFSAY